MRVATSTNIISTRRDRPRVPMIEFIPFLAQHGYSVLDLNLCEIMNPGSALRTDKWRSYVDQLKQYRTDLNLTYNQAHAPYHKQLYSLSNEEKENLTFEINRSLEIAGELEIPYIVLHAISDAYGFSQKEHIEINMRWLEPFVENASSYGTYILLENLFTRLGEPEAFTTNVQDLVALIDAFNSPYVGACYDFGHAHLTEYDHVENLKYLGKRLLALHVADNHGKEDEHLLPFYGTVPWEVCMKALKRINYRGDFTYEVMFFSQYLPVELHPSFLRHSLDVANHLVDLFHHF
jgi:sugar phosphate isomerase/epimerase